MKTTITPLRSLLTILRLRSGFILITLAAGTLALVQRAESVNPPPDGGYAGGNTAEGQGALLNLTSGTFNTAVGFFSLRATPKANSTQPSTLARFSPTPQTTIQALALERF